MTDKKKLTPKQQKFADEYIKNGGNGAAAIKEAYPAVKSNRNAAVMAANNLSKDHIKGEIDRITSDISKECVDIMQHSKMLQQALESAYADMASNDPKVRSDARKFIASIHKDLKTSESSTKTLHQHVHLARPKRK